MQRQAPAYPESFFHPARPLLAGGMLLLAYEPLRWLAATWADPSYDSKGFYVFAVCAALFCWSVTSEARNPDPRAQRLAWRLLFGTLAVRAAGQLFAINVIGALALVIDCFALGLLAGLPGRKRSLSPGWLAVLFTFSLPVERILQRTAGFALQSVSAEGACAGLKAFAPDTVCEGLRILMAGKDVLVDLPCSGARMLVLLCIFYSALMAVARPSFRRGMAIIAAAGVSALAANVLRIMLLALGIAYPQHAGVDVMAEPWHSIVGLCCLLLAALPGLFLAFGRGEARRKTSFREIPFKSRATGALPAALFVCFALVAVSLPRKPVDVAAPAAAPHLPVYVGGDYGAPVNLAAREAAYFTSYGGGAAKMRYGDNSIMIVRTSSPLRHLHAPDECLRGMGYSVEYKGLSHAPIPTALYNATGTDGRRWRIAVTFRSDSGLMTTNVSEAVWRWMQNRETWQAIQRITPLSLSESAASAWDGAVIAALELKEPQPLEIAYADPHY